MTTTDDRNCHLIVVFRASFDRPDAPRWVQVSMLAEMLALALSCGVAAGTAVLISALIANWEPVIMTELVVVLTGLLVACVLTARMVLGGWFWADGSGRTRGTAAKRARRPARGIRNRAPTAEAADVAPPAGEFGFANLRRAWQRLAWVQQTKGGDPVSSVINRMPMRLRWIDAAREQPLSRA